jgi:hypothetical protein
MPNTLVDDGGPAGQPEPAFPAAPQKTLPDEGDSGPSAPTPDPAPKPSRGRWPYFLIGGLLLLSVIGPMTFYFFVWRYRPTALMHIPRGTSVAVRFDGRELYLYEPFRKHIIGAFDDAAEKGGRADRLKKHTGLDVRKDVREVILATSFGESWVVLIGGNFSSRAKTKFTLGLSKFLEEEGVSGFTRRSDGVLEGPVFVAQAEDSTIVIANTEETLTRSIEPGDTYQDLGLASSGAMSFVIDRPAFDAIASGHSLVKASPFVALGSVTETAGQTQKLTGHLAFGKEPEFLLDVTPTKGSDPETLSKQLETVQSQVRLGAMFLPDFGGLLSVASGAKIKPRAKSVMVEAPWPKDKLNAFLEEAGSAMRVALGAPEAK